MSNRDRLQAYLETIHPRGPDSHAAESSVARNQPEQRWTRTRDKRCDGCLRPPLKDLEDQPASITGARMYPYQIRGMNWLRQAWSSGHNAILADEMGLGKTLQTIGFLASLRQQKLVRDGGRFLVICPLSVAQNWADEFSRFLGAGADSTGAPLAHASLIGQKTERTIVRTKLLGARRPFDMAKWRRERLPRLVELRQELDKRQKRGRNNRGAAQDSDDEDDSEQDSDSEDEGDSECDEDPFDQLTEADLRDYILEDPGDKEDEDEEDEPDRDDGRSRPGVFQVLITSYEGFLAEQDFFCRGYLRGDAWDCLIVDEAHRLKNPQSVLHIALRDQLPARMRVLLTGTPCQNDLNELWGLLHFLEPDCFDDEQSFVSRFRSLRSQNTTSSSPAKDAANKALAEELHEILELFLLRRDKVDVKLQIPAKQEIVIRTALTPLQRRLYKALLHKNLGLLGDAASAASSNRRGLTNLVVALRKCCNHPYLFEGVEPEPYEEGDHLWQASGKFVVLDQLLDSLKRRGRRVLIFSTSVQSLDVLQDYLAYRGHNYERLDGSVRGEERFLAIDRFTRGAASEGAFVFLLSTRAGGQGLNLTSADTAIFLDSDWNPQVDKQAEARVHRIGQRRGVLSIRLVCSNTLEEFIHLRAQHKLRMTEVVLQQGRFGGGDGSAAAPSSAAAEPSTKDDASPLELRNLLSFGLDRLFEENEDDVDTIAAKARETIDQLLDSAEVADRESLLQQQQQQQQQPSKSQPQSEPQQNHSPNSESEGGECSVGAVLDDAEQPSDESSEYLQQAQGSLYFFEGRDYTGSVRSKPPTKRRPQPRKLVKSPASASSASSASPLSLGKRKRSQTADEGSGGGDLSDDEIMILEDDEAGDPDEDDFDHGEEDELDLDSRTQKGLKALQQLQARQNAVREAEVQRKRQRLMEQAQNPDGTVRVLPSVGTRNRPGAASLLSEAEQAEAEAALAIRQAELREERSRKARERKLEKWQAAGYHSCSIELRETSLHAADGDDETDPDEDPYLGDSSAARYINHVNGDASLPELHPSFSETAAVNSGRDNRPSLRRAESLALNSSHSYEDGYGEGQGAGDSPDVWDEDDEDSSAASSGAPDGSKGIIILSAVDNSGSWGRGGFFSALDARSRDPGKAYERAARNGDLKLGDAHLVPIPSLADASPSSSSSSSSSALSDSGELSGLRLQHLDTALQKVAQAASDLNCSVHLPRIGARTKGFNWYAVERLLRKHLGRRRIPTYVYYFRRSGGNSRP